MSRAVLAGVFLVMFVVAGCAQLNNLIKLGGDIEGAGYDSVGCQSNSFNGHTVLEIQASTSAEPATQDDANRIARVVWEKYDGTFDELRITVNGATVLDRTESELADMFGDRPAGVVTEKREVANFTLVIVLTAVGALLFVGLAVLVWWRGRRPPPPVAPPTYQYPPHVN